MHSQRVVRDWRLPPSFRLELRKNLKGTVHLLLRATNQSLLTSQIHTSNTAADASYAVSPQLFRTSGFADCFVKR